MRPPDVEPEIKELGEPYEGYQESHPSYAMVRFSRCSGGHANLYGSSISHQNYISITIVRGTRHRHLNTDWYHGEIEPLIEIKLSPSQFVEAMTNMNHGSGVPCTLDHFNGETMPNCPERHKRQEVQDEFKGRMSKMLEKASLAEQMLADLVQPGRTIKKADVRGLQEAVSSAVAEIRCGAPFAHECFNEACDQAASEAKAEIDAAFTGMIAKLGMEKAQERIGELLEISEAPKPRSIESKSEELTQ